MRRGQLIWEKLHNSKKYQVFNAEYKKHVCFHIQPSYNWCLANLRFFLIRLSHAQNYDEKYPLTNRVQNENFQKSLFYNLIKPLLFLFMSLIDKIFII